MRQLNCSEEASVLCRKLDRLPSARPMLNKSCGYPRGPTGPCTVGCNKRPQSMTIVEECVVGGICVHVDSVAARGAKNRGTGRRTLKLSRPCHGGKSRAGTSADESPLLYIYNDDSVQGQSNCVVMEIRSITTFRHNQGICSREMQSVANCATG